MKTLFPFYIIVAAACFGCASQGFPATDPNDYQNEEGDFGQCLSLDDCDNLANDANAYRAPFDGNKAETIHQDLLGFFGMLDDECHKWYTTNDGVTIFTGDIDYIPLKAEPGTPLTVRVTRVPGEKTSPVLTLRNTEAIDMVFGGQPDSSGTSQISFLMPTEIAYLAVEEAKNYGDEKFIQKGSDTICDKSYTGGDNYHYLLTVTNPPEDEAKDMIFDVGTLTDTLSVENHILNAPGTTRYYRLKLDKSKQNSEITVDIAASSSFLNQRIAISPITRGDGNYNWSVAGTTNLGMTRIDSDTYEQIIVDYKYAALHDDYYEFMFVVTDIDGNYGYPYSISFKFKQ